MRSEDSCEGRWTAVFESQLQTWPVPNSLFFDHSSENLKADMEGKFQVVFETLDQLLTFDSKPKKIGFLKEEQAKYMNRR